MADSTYMFFNQVALNSNGSVAFSGHIQAAAGIHNYSQAIWTDQNGIISLVALEGASAQNADPGEFYDGFDIGFNGLPHIGAHISDTSHTAFYGYTTQDTSYYRRGYWVGPPGDASLIAAENSQAPGTEVGVTFGSNLNRPTFSSNGQIAFVADLQGSSIDNTNRYGLWANTSDQLQIQKVARSGDAAPGMVPGSIFGQFQNYGHMLNTQGTLIFESSLVGPGATISNNQVVWSWKHGILNAVLSEGDQAPGTPLGTLFHHPNGSSPFSDISLNSYDQLAFVGDLYNLTMSIPHDLGIYRWTFGQTELIALIGDHAPGTGQEVTFNGLSRTVINDRGDVLFTGNLIGGAGTNSSNNKGLWLAEDDSIELLIRTGSHAPGTAEGVNFSSFGSTPLLNTASQIIFDGVVEGPGVNSQNNVGIWAIAPDRSISLLAREGDPFDVNDDPLIEDFRTIKSLTLSRGNGKDGRPSSFNDRGQLALIIDFTDGTSGIFVANTRLPGDLNGDGFVGIDDLTAVLNNWNHNVTPGDALAGDATGDGYVGIDDLNTILPNWNAGTPPSEQNTAKTGLNAPEPASLMILAGLLGLHLRRV